jgi:hypothetical protein
MARGELGSGGRRNTALRCGAVLLPTSTFDVLRVSSVRSVANTRPSGRSPRPQLQLLVAPRGNSQKVQHETERGTCRTNRAAEGEEGERARATTAGPNGLVRLHYREWTESCSLGSRSEDRRKQRRRHQPPPPIQRCRRCRKVPRAAQVLLDLGLIISNRQFCRAACFRDSCSLGRSP